VKGKNVLSKLVATEGTTGSQRDVGSEVAYGDYHRVTNPLMDPSVLI